MALSVLRPETQFALRGVRARPPTFSTQITAELFDARTGRGRFQVLITGEGRHIVYDPMRELGKRTCGEFRTEAEAVTLAATLSERATAAGEANSPERHGWGRDWSRAESWEEP